MSGKCTRTLELIRINIYRVWSLAKVTIMHLLIHVLETPTILMCGFMLNEESVGLYFYFIPL